MATEILIKNATPIVWANNGDYNPAAGEIYPRTAQIDLTSLANAAARQGAKVDLGAVRAARYIVRVCIEANVAPASGVTSEVYFSMSNHATVGLDNPGFCTGADAAYVGTPGDGIADSVKLMVGPFVYIHTADVAAISLPMNCGILLPMQRYISPVVVNNCAQAYEGDAVEMYLALIPIVDESQ